jgi:hypothetical protein
MSLDLQESLLSLKKPKLLQTPSLELLNCRMEQLSSLYINRMKHSRITHRIPYLPRLKYLTVAFQKDPNTQSSILVDFDNLPSLEASSLLCLVRPSMVLSGNANMLTTLVLEYCEFDVDLSVFFNIKDLRELVLVGCHTEMQHILSSPLELERLKLHFSDPTKLFHGPIVSKVEILDVMAMRSDYTLWSWIADLIELSRSSIREIYLDDGRIGDPPAADLPEDLFNALLHVEKPSNICLEKSLRLRREQWSRWQARLAQLTREGSAILEYVAAEGEPSDEWASDTRHKSSLCRHRSRTPGNHSCSPSQRWLGFYDMTADIIWEFSRQIGRVGGAWRITESQTSCTNNDRDYLIG